MLSDIFHRVDLPPKVDGESSQGTCYLVGGEEGGGEVVVTRGGVGKGGPNLCYRYHDITPSGTVTINSCGLHHYIYVYTYVTPTLTQRMIQTNCRTM